MNNRRTNNTKQESCHSLAAHPFSGTADRCLGKLQLIRVSQVRILPRFRRVAQSGRAVKRFPKTRCLLCRPFKYFQVA